jgi:outer membrane receptor for ferrienterochelin and colicin
MTGKKLSWRPTALALAASLCVVATAVHAQQTSGSLGGRAASGDVVTVQNKAINVTREVKVGAEGAWQLGQLPPGTYTVTVKRANGTTDTTLVEVAAGQAATATFGGIQTITVTGSAIRTLDVTTVNPSFVISKAEIERLPVAANVTAVTLLAPGTVQGDGGFGVPGVRTANLASINGSSVAENAYYINGFNVTNINKGIAFNEVPFEAIGEVQVLNGGYGADFGRSLGGVVSVNTKRGTNEWKGGGIVSWAPNEMRGSPLYADKSTVTGKWNLVEKPGFTERINANAYVGGPLIKDSLYVFALVEARDSKDEVYGQNDHVFYKSTSPRWLTKFDWNINKNNLVELTLFNDTTKDTEYNYTAVAPYTTQLGSFDGSNWYKTGGQNTIAKWTSFLTDDLTVSALVGRGKYSRSTFISTAACPVVQERRSGFTSANLGCWTGSGLVDVPNASDERRAFRVDLEWNINDRNTLRAGIDSEKFTTVDGSQYSGGNAYRVLRVANGSQVGFSGYFNNTGAPLDVVRYRYYKNGGTFETKNSAWYLEDTFKATKDFLVTAGIRSESFENLNDLGGSFIKVNNTISPRMGFAWDLGGKAETKVYGNLGRYYIPVYSNTNVRLSGAETFWEEYYTFNGYGPGPQQVPSMGAQLGDRFTYSDGSAKDPRTVVDPNIKPLYQDELILGFEQALRDRWSFGVKYTKRMLKNGMDDICEGDLARTWALANGYTADQAANIRATINGCFLYNPGGPLVANVDLDDTGTLTPVKIPASALLMPKPQRKYDSLEFMLQRQWDKKWSAQASLVIAWSRGNTEGYVKSDNQQDDAGITTDFDHPGLMEGSYGWLPNDRRYTVKASGTYALSDEWRFTASGVLQSGRPKSCYGYYTGPIPDQSPAYGAASYYCGGVLGYRGDQGRLEWTRDLSLQVQYQPQWAKGFTFKADFFNVLNNRAVRGVNEEGEAGGSNSPNPDYMRPRLATLQPARSMRLTASYEF